MESAVSNRIKREREGEGERERGKERGRVKKRRWGWIAGGILKLAFTEQS